MNRLGRALKVHPGEGRLAGLGIALMLATAAGAALGQSGVDALFFARSGVDKLPVMYMVSGGLMFVASIAVTGLLGRVTRERLFTALPLVVASVFLAERAIVAAGPAWIYPALWLTAGLAQMCQGLFTWGMVGMVADTRQAKRLFPLFGAGGILGAVIGGLSTRPLAEAAGAENLLFAWAIGLVVAVVAGRALIGGRARPGAAVRRRSRRPKGRLLEEMQQGFRFVRRSPVMKWMSAAAVLFSVLFFSLYLPFSRAATERFPGEDALAGFFGAFSAVTTGAALLASLFLTNRLFARFGVATMILVLPVIYLAGFGILIVDAAFVTLVAIRFVQMPWIQAVAAPAWESVINVVPPARRDQVRAFLNGGPAQAGTIIAGLILLIGREALSPTQLYVIGLSAAGLTTFTVWRVRRTYADALVDALRAGRPEVFPEVGEEEPFGGTRVDASAVATLVAGASDPDVHVRRAAVEILGDLPVDPATDALTAATRDPDPTVRATAFRSLARAGQASAMNATVGGLTDTEAEVRLAAVRAVGALGGDGSDAAGALRVALGDPDPAVRSSAAGVILRRSPDDTALAAVRALLEADDPEPRVLALRAFEEAGVNEGFGPSAEALKDRRPAVRSAAARALAACDPLRAVPPLVASMGDEDAGVRESVALALSRIGPPAMESVLEALADPALAPGAILALERLPATLSRDAITAYARGESSRAQADLELLRSIGPDGDDRVRLLRDSLLDRARSSGRSALRSASLLGERESIRFALDNLTSRDQAQVANALEALETLGQPEIVRPLLPLWEPVASPGSPREEWLPRLLDDPDPWIRDCAALVHAARKEGATVADALATLSEMERVLFLRKVPMFADLAPQDLKRVAAIAEERTYVDGETIAGQGETGEEMHVVVEGGVLVLREGQQSGKETELARRARGDVVGEMAIITREPRMASLVASGDVRTLCVGRKEFEGMLRERPDTALAVMRVLSDRLVEISDAIARF